jgi:hypothetical protein
LSSLPFSAHSRASGNPVLSFPLQSLDPRVRGDERSVWLASTISPIQISISQRSAARVLAAPGTPSSYFVPRKIRGMARREDASGSQLRIFLLRRCGAFRRAIAASLRRRAALSATACGAFDHSQNTTPFGRPCHQVSNAPCGPPSASSWQEVRAEPRHRPSAWLARPRPRAPRPCSTIKTPHDSALVEQDGM